MRQSETESRLTPRHLQAARLVAEDTHTDVEIARLAHIGKATLERWKQRPDFREKVLALRREIEQRLLADCRYASKIQRVLALAKEIDALADVFDARAADPEAALAPGGQTGRLVVEDKVIGTGDMAARITTSKVDDGAIALKASLLRQIAQELGQWTEKREHSFDLRKEAEKLAGELGMAPEQLLREAGLTPD